MANLAKISLKNSNFSPNSGSNSNPGSEMNYPGSLFCQKPGFSGSGSNPGSIPNSIKSINLMVHNRSLLRGTVIYDCALNQNFLLFLDIIGLSSLMHGNEIQKGFDLENVV